MSKPITEATIEHWFTYHPAKPATDKRPSQGERYGIINEVAKNFARAILATCPEGDDRDAALRTLRRLRMDANLAIACEDAP